MPIQVISSQQAVSVDVYFKNTANDLGKKGALYAEKMLELAKSIEEKSNGYTVWVVLSMISLVCVLDNSPSSAIIRIEPTEKGYRIICALDFIRPSLNGKKVAVQELEDVDLAGSTVFEMYKEFIDFHDIANNGK